MFRRRSHFQHATEFQLVCGFRLFDYPFTLYSSSTYYAADAATDIPKANTPLLHFSGQSSAVRASYAQGGLLKTSLLPLTF